MFDVLLKGRSLLGCTRGIIEPENDLHILEALGIHLVPVGGRSKQVVVSGRPIGKERHRLPGEIHVIGFDIS